VEPGWHRFTFEVIDYFIQAVLVILGFVYPWVVPRVRRWSLVVYPLLIAFIWGIWRMVLFDPAFHNDVPGIGYWFMGVVLALVASGFYIIRRFCTRSRPAPSPASAGEGKQ
jgi:hypothetical protein